MSNRLHSRLRAERTARGWTQARTAAAAGITRQSYAALESGASVPSVEVALRLARALDTAVEAVFWLPGEGRPGVQAEPAGGPIAEGAPVRLARVAGRTLAFAMRAGGMQPLQPADGVAVPDGGEGLRVRLLADAPPPPDLVVHGCDPAFGVLAAMLRRERGWECLWLQRGSRAALAALAAGETHVAGVHWYDAATGTYNEPWIRRLVPFPCARVAFAVWEEALLVRAGNPLGIRGVADLAQPRMRFLNREPGSGARALLDAHLRAAGVSGEAIPGYPDTAASGHLAVAEAVASGVADAGPAIRAAAVAYGLDAVPLAPSRYDLVIPRHFLDLPAVQALLDLLRRASVRAQVEALGGYDAAAMGEPA
jgi:putative molybdopterin biosynthesis protein